MSKLLRCVPVLLLMPLFIAGCTGEETGQEQQNWQTENLKGAVKSYTQSVYKATEKFGKIEKGEQDNVTRVVDNKDFDNIIAAYNEKGDLIERSIYYADSTLFYKEKFVYNDEGKQIEGCRYDANGTLEGKTKFLYDEKGNLIEIDFYESDGSLNWKIMCAYDEKGNQIERNFYESDGSLDGKITRTYDEKGKEIESTHYESDGSLVWKEKYVYDKNGKLIEKSRSDHNGTNKIWERYDDKGNPTEWSGPDLEGNSSEGKCTYQYDQKGNWTQMVIYINGVPVNIVEREYTYY